VTQPQPPQNPTPPPTQPPPPQNPRPEESDQEQKKYDGGDIPRTGTPDEKKDQPNQ
jgi:hypothetical protein